MIFNNVKELRKWRSDRHITEVPDIKVYVENILEELLEMFYDDKLEIKYHQECIIDRYFDKKPFDDDSAVIDAISDIRVFSINQTELMGYDANECLCETIKEISSREQDPIQKEIWSKWGYDGSKWLKDKDQDSNTLYKADYSKCKICK